MLVETAASKIVESSPCLAVAREGGSGIAPTADVEVQLVHDKVGAVNDALGSQSRGFMAHGVVDAADEVPDDDDPGIKIVEIGGDKS